LDMTPPWLNFFENLLTVQFMHRMLAYSIAVIAGVILWKGWATNRFAGVHAWLPILGVLLGGQIFLGIATLVLVVPMPLAIGHQALAFILFASCIAYLADMNRRR